jgi:hypothetical protein
MSDQVYDLKAKRKSRQDTEGTLRLKEASNPPSSGYEIADEENNLQPTNIITATRLGFQVSFYSEILKVIR